MQLSIHFYKQRENIFRSAQRIGAYVVEATAKSIAEHRKLHGKVSPVAALTLNFFYKSYDVTIVGYQLNEGWRMALELRNGSSAEVIRDTSTIYPDFNSLRSMAIWLAHQKIREKEERPSPENGNS